MNPRSNDLKVCMLAAEVRPYCTVGGLADVAADLPNALLKLGVEVRTFAPLYRNVHRVARLKKVSDLPPVRMGNLSHQAAVYRDAEQSTAVNFFIENDAFFDREGIYNDPETGEGYEDGFERYNFFMLATLEALRVMDWKPDVIHSHDSHSALVPAYLRLDRQGNPFYQRIATLLTIHNLAYQGVYGAEKFALTGLPGELFYSMGPFEFFGRLNFLKAGICYSDVVNTVSPHYAKEIQTEAYGCGLQDTLHLRHNDLFGILNGIDTDLWNPERDPLIFANYGIDSLEGKKVNKERLQNFCGFPVREVPLIGIISRLVEQKGFDLILEVREELARIDAQWVILGSGMKVYQDALGLLSEEFPEKFATFVGYDNELAHRIEAGSDMFLMPSRFEPCGLNQMYSMRYGSIPIVRHTGGLVDTVTHFSRRNGFGTGFRFFEYSSRELLTTIREAIQIWKSDGEAWRQLIRNAMSQDFSWDRSARRYLDTYWKAVNRG